MDRRELVRHGEPDYTAAGNRVRRFEEAVHDSLEARDSVPRANDRRVLGHKQARGNVCLDRVVVPMESSVVDRHLATFVRTRRLQERAKATSSREPRKALVLCAAKSDSHVRTPLDRPLDTNSHKSAVLPKLRHIRRGHRRRTERRHRCRHEGRHIRGERRRQCRRMKAWHWRRNERRNKTRRGRWFERWLQRRQGRWRDRRHRRGCKSRREGWQSSW